MKRVEPLRLDAIIERMIDATGLRTDLGRHTIESAWPRIVGRHISDYTGRLYVQGTKLHVYITSAALKEELGYARAQLVDRLNEAAGADVIDDILIH